MQGQESDVPVGAAVGASLGAAVGASLGTPSRQRRLTGVIEQPSPSLSHVLLQVAARMIGSD